jgi:hypothetical protein
MLSLGLVDPTLQAAEPGLGTPWQQEERTAGSGGGETCRREMPTSEAKRADVIGRRAVQVDASSGRRPSALMPASLGVTRAELDGALDGRAHVRDLSG